MADIDVQPVEADLADLEDQYPEGVVVLAEKEDDHYDWGQFRAVVTGHHVVESSGSVRYKYPGPRVDVSTCPPNAPQVDDDLQAASALRPCEIIDVVDSVDLDGDA